MIISKRPGADGRSIAETSQSKSDRPEIVKHAARINPMSPAPIRMAGFIVAMPVNAAKAAKMSSVALVRSSRKFAMFAITSLPKEFEVGFAPRRSKRECG